MRVKTPRRQDGRVTRRKAQLEGEGPGDQGERTQKGCMRVKTPRRRDGRATRRAMHLEGQGPGGKGKRTQPGHVRIEIPRHRGGRVTQGGSTAGRTRAQTARPLAGGSSVAPERATKPRGSDRGRKHWTRGGGGRPLRERRARRDVEGKWLTRSGRGMQQGEGATPGTGAGDRGAGEAVDANAHGAHQH